MPQNNSNANGSYTGNSAIATTALLGNVTNFYVVRHASYNSLDTTNYNFHFPTSKGNITVDGLSLHGRDSKIFVSDYDAGGINVLYSTAEIFTWKKYGNKRVLVVYGGPGETNELAIVKSQTGKCVEGQGVQTDNKDGVSVIRFTSSSERKVVDVGDDLSVYILGK